AARITEQAPTLVASTFTSPILSGSGACTAPPTTCPSPAAKAPSTTYHASREMWLPTSMKHAAALIAPSRPEGTTHGGSRSDANAAAGTSIDIPTWSQG